MQKLRITAPDGFPSFVEVSQLETYQKFNSIKETEKQFVIEMVEVDENNKEVSTELCKGSAKPRVNPADLAKENESLKAQLAKLEKAAEKAEHKSGK